MSLTNYSADVLFNLSIAVELTFREPLPVPGQEKSRTQGPITLQREWTISIPKLDPAPAEPYVFYIWNQNVRRFIHVRLPSYGLTEGRKKVPLIQSEHNLSQPLNPDPFN